MNSANIKSSIPFVAVAYLKRDIKRNKDAIDAYYKEFQNDFTDSTTDQIN